LNASDLFLESLERIQRHNEIEILSDWELAERNLIV